MSRLKPWIVLLLVFAAGFIVGGGATAMHFYVKIGKFLHHPGPPPMEHVAGHLSQVLHLDKEQEALARDILDKHRPETEAILTQCKADMDAVLKSVSRELMPSLNPEQREELEAFTERMASGGWGGPGGPPPGPGPRPPAQE